MSNAKRSTAIIRTVKNGKELIRIDKSRGRYIYYFLHGILKDCKGAPKFRRSCLYDMYLEYMQANKDLHAEINGEEFDIDGLTVPKKVLFTAIEAMGIEPQRIGNDYFFIYDQSHFPSFDDISSSLFLVDEAEYKAAGHEMGIVKARRILRELKPDIIALSTVEDISMSDLHEVAKNLLKIAEMKDNVIEYMVEKSVKTKKEQAEKERRDKIISEFRGENDRVVDEAAE